MAINPESFKDSLRHFPSGVTIVTIKSKDQVHGLTISAFASVSPNPPLIMVVIDHRHNAFTLMEEEGATFAVSILGEDQEFLSERFAWVSDEDRFSVGDWDIAVTGAPVLRDALAWMDCTVYGRYSTGTHHIYLGEVQASKVARPDESPLLYWNRAYHKVDLESDE
jgi:flavin reductase (DIM6/NTAB) family NADH-FMN oxidoreductase RutF